MLQKPNKTTKIVRSIFVIFLLIPWLIFLSNYFQIPESGLLTLEGRYENKQINIDQSNDPPPQISPLTLEGQYGKKQLIVNNPNDIFLLQGKIITGKFVSQFPNLGIVAVRFETFNRINDDWLTFRIKEITASDWYYVASYKTDQFQPNQLFPFGFPLITESAEKTYQFEIESQKGQPENYVAVDTDYPTFVSRHVYTREEVKSNIKKLLFIFVNKLINILFQKNTPSDNSLTVHMGNFMIFSKIFNLFGDEFFRFNSFVYLFPLIYYLLVLRFRPKFTFLVLFLLTTMIVNVFFLKRNSDYLLLSCVIIGLMIQIHYPKKIKYFIPVLLALLLSASIFTILKLDIITERITVWLYLLLVVIAVYQLLSKRTLKSIKLVTDRL